MSRRRAIWSVVGAVALVVVVAVAVLVVTGMSAQRDLVRARSGLTRVQSSLLAGEPAVASERLLDVQRSTNDAAASTSNVVWRLAGAVPYIGRTPKAITKTSQTADDLATTALPGLVDAAALIDPAKLQPKGGSAVDTTAIAKAVPVLELSAQAAADAARRMDAVDVSGTPSAVATRIQAVRDSVSELAKVTTSAAAAARIAPAMLGADGPRRYLLVVQTPSESRGTGGLIGAYAVVEADQGRLSVVTQGPRSRLDPSNLAKPALDLGPDYENLWGTDPGYWVNANESPHFPYAASLWQAMSARAGLGRIDGVVATDPVALAALMKVTGPARLPDGSTVTADQIVPLVTKDVYAKIPSSDRRRDAYLQVVAKSALDSVLSGHGSSRKMLKALAAMAGQRRILVWSHDPAQQEVLQTLAVGGAVPPTSPATATPYAFVVVNNAAGSKLDAYLDREVEYSAAACPVDPTTPRKATLTIRLRNSAPTSGLPRYVAPKLVSAGRAEPAGTNRLLVNVYLSRGAGVVRATLDGSALRLGSGQEQGHPVVGFTVTLPPGRQDVVRLDLTEPAWHGAARVDVQPLVRDQVTRTDVPVC